MDEPEKCKHCMNKRKMQILLALHVCLIHIDHMREEMAPEKLNLNTANQKPQIMTTTIPVRKMTAQELAIDNLERKGFRFDRWVYDTDGSGEPMETAEAVMVKRVRHGHETRYVDSDGTVN